jgi:RNA polymerase sigma-70 factor (ECF subfamily)
MCGSREQAEDLVQDTFARVMAKPRFLHRDDDLGYLLRTLRNLHISSLRRAHRAPRTVPLDDTIAIEDRRSLRPQEAAEASALYSLIAALPAGARDALVAVDLMGLSYAQAARALRTREATIATRLFRARQLVARQLDGEAAAPAPAADASASKEPDPPPASFRAAPARPG